MAVRPWTWELSSQAVEDLHEILAWTSSMFGLSQAKIYRAVIYAALRALRKGPKAIGVRKRDDIVPGIMVLHVAREGRRGRHFLLFRVASGDDQEIEVVRILHDQMDLAHHIPPTE